MSLFSRIVPVLRRQKIKNHFLQKFVHNSNLKNMPHPLNLNDRPKLHDRPIIGIMAVMAEREIGRFALPAAYVKNVEMAGARVVPVLPDQSESYYRELFEKLNGLFLPGGWSAPTLEQKPVTEAASYFYRWSIKALKNGEKSDYFPIWGTCLGFEMLMDITEGMSGDLLSRCNVPQISFPLKLTKEGRQTRLISDLPDDLLEALDENPVLPHSHTYCVTVEDFNSSGLNEFYTLVGTNRDENGILYVGAIEAREYPIYGVMSHPEKTIYSWTQRYDYDRSIVSIRIAQYLVNFFVQECCKNDHHFTDPTEEHAVSIYNYQPVFTARDVPGSVSEQCYYFD